MNTYKEYLEIIKKAALKAGEIMLSADYDEVLGGIESKEGTANFVTEYDKKVQDFLFETLAASFPAAVFVGEEDDGSTADKIFNGLAFIIDPIDGTTNFIRNFCASTVSIALLCNGSPIVGVVYNPYSGDLYCATKGGGAFCNDKPIKTVKRPFSQSIVEFGTAPYYKGFLGDKTFALAKALFMSGADLRRSGSAALDLCTLASGKCDIFFEVVLSPWDYAASFLILAEAGGVMTDFYGNEPCFDKRCSILACSCKGISDQSIGIIEKLGFSAQDIVFDD